MKNGFLRVATAVPSIKVADCDFNAEQIIAKVKEAHQQGIKLLCFPELCLTGCSCGDLFLQTSLLEKVEACLRVIAEQTIYSEMVFVVGAPIRHKSNIYNCAIAFQGGEILGIVPKQHLTLFETRYFCTTNCEMQQIQINKDFYIFGHDLIFECKNMSLFKFAIEIGEDLFACPTPSDHLCNLGANIILNPSAIPEIIGADNNRRLFVSAQSARHNCCYLLASAGEGESSTDCVYGGHSMIAENGSVLQETIFDYSILIADLDLELINYERQKSKKIIYDNIPNRTEFTINIASRQLDRKFNPLPFIAQNSMQNQENCAKIIKLQSQGLAKRLSHTNSKKLILGISGGLDSALALIVACETMDLLGRDRADIMAITLPCFGTTSRTRDNSEVLSKSLGASFSVINIKKAVEMHFEDIGQDPNTLDATYENSQARERTQVLMDLAGKHHGFVVGTGDLSELALGFATYNGDHMSMYNVNCGLPKTLLREVVSYYANNCQNLQISNCLKDILDTPISPELLPSDANGKITQQTESIVGPYELHDFFIYYSLKYGFNPSKIFRMCCVAYENKYSPTEILAWEKFFYQRFFSQQFKRSCSPDGVRVLDISLSPRGELRMPSDACSKLWLQDLEEIIII